MPNKISRIVNSTFTSQWTAPNNKVLYYHKLIMENGDEGTCGLAEQSPPKIWSGAIITYTIDEKNKIKVISSDMDNETKPNGNQKSNNGGKGGVAKQDSFLGYAWSYAKDLVIAGKTMDDIEELNKMARYIYTEIGKMLQNE